jgi:hypothetical protein
MNADSSPADASRQGSAGFIAAVVVLLLVCAPLLYALSIGPAIVLFHRGTIDEEQIDRAYAPILYIDNRCEASRPLLRGYVRLWLRLADIDFRVDEAP